MASETPVSVRGSRLGSRLSSIVQELQKQQIKETIASPKQVRPKKLSIRPDVVVALMGATGSGKSSFIRRTTGNDEVKVGDSLCSTTQQVQHFKLENGGTQYSIVDTPGFNDTYRTDSDILKELADWLLKSVQEGVKISGIIYLHRISDPRMEGSAMRNLRMFRKLCGDDFMSNVVLGTTFWDLSGEEKGAAREAELMETGGFFKDMRDRGCEIVRISDDREANLQLLSRFAAKAPTVMQIQQELLEGKSVTEAAASSAISQELAELQRLHIEEMEDFEYKKSRITTVSSLELVYSRAIDRRAFEKQLEELAEAQEEARTEKEEQERADDERIANLQSARDRQKQTFQVKLDELEGQLQAMRATTACQ